MTDTHLGYLLAFSALLLFSVSIMVTKVASSRMPIAAMRFIPLSVVTLSTLCTPMLVFPVSYFRFRTKGELTKATLLGSAIALLGVAIIVVR